MRCVRTLTSRSQGPDAGPGEPLREPDREDRHKPAVPPPLRDKPQEASTPDTSSAPKIGRAPAAQKLWALVVEPMEAGPRALLGRRLDVLYRPGLGTGSPALLYRILSALAPTVLIVRNRTRVDSTLLTHAAPSLRVVGRLGTGLDNIDQSALARRGIRLVATPGTGASAVAELVFAYLLHVSRALEAANAHVRAGGWDRDQMGGHDLAGRRLGLVGMGEVGLRVALRARAFDMRVAAYDPHLPRHAFPFESMGVERAETLDALLARVDFVSLHVPLTSETHHLIAANALSRMRPGSHLIHTARGAVVDEAALEAGLRSGRIAGCLLDVREHEPPLSPDPLAAFPQVVMTPHIGGLTQEARIRTGRELVRGVLAALAEISAS